MAAKLNWSVQFEIVVVPVFVIVMLAWKPVLQDETSEYVTDVLVVGGARMLTLAVPEMAPLCAFTVADPAAFGAVYSPLAAPIVPAPLETDHASAGWVLMGFPNWS